MSAISRRSVVVGIGIALGCLFSGCTATTQIPESITAGQRLLVFAGMMTGPFCTLVLWGVINLGYSPLTFWQALGVLSIPLIMSHLFKPSVLTACISTIGIALWYWVGFISVIFCYYAG